MSRTNATVSTAMVASGGSLSPGQAEAFFCRGRRLVKTKSGYKYNCIDEDNGDLYWVSGPRKDGADKLYGGLVQIDADARVEYWTKIRAQPTLGHLTEYRAGLGTRTERHTRGNDLSLRARSKSRP
jgi:hypothetical protein